MKVDALAAVQRGAEMQNMKPYVDSEIDSLQKAVVSFVLGHINKGTLTPEMALTKWVEYASYIKLGQKFDQRIAVGQSVGAENKQSLDFRI